MSKYQDIEKSIRKCKRCNEIKPFSDFNKQKGCTFGISWVCLDCENKRKREYKLLNKEKVKEGAKIYRDKNKSQALDYSRNYNTINRDLKNKKAKIYYKQNKEIILLKEKKHRGNPVVIKRRRASFETRMVNNPNTRVTCNIRARIQTALKSQHTSKSIATMRLVGCNKDELVLYLESLFLEGMSWENYGLHGWHIDHIKPLASFDLSNEDELKKANHYTNLQPLWAKDNLSKGAKF